MSERHSGRKRTFGESAEIDARAKSHFESLMRIPDFITRRWNPDTFIDYKVEILEGGEPTGIFAYVQLKGQAKVKISNDLISYAIKSKHLRYYSEKLREPVLLVLVDSTNTRAYFLFLQEWIDLNVKELLHHGTVSVKIPVSNTLEVIPLVKERMKTSAAYMIRKHPGSVDDAISAELAALTKLDPRVVVKMDIVNNTRCFQLSASEHLNLRMKIGLAADQKAVVHEKMQQLLNYGKAAIFGEAKVSVTGSPLFEKLINSNTTTGLAISASKVFPCELIVSDSSRRLLIVVRGDITRGIVGINFTFSGNDPVIPLQLSLLLEKTTIDQGGSSVIQIGWNYAPWLGLPVKSLPYLTPLHQFFTQLINQENLIAEFRLNGEHLGESEVGGKMPPSEGIRDIYNILDILIKAKALTGKIQKDLILPSGGAITADDLSGIEMAYNLFLVGEHVIYGDDIRINGTFCIAKECDISGLIKTSDIPAPLEITFEQQTVSIFGEEIKLGPLKATIEKAIQTIIPESITRLKAGHSDGLVTEFRAVLGSPLRIVRACAKER